MCILHPEYGHILGVRSGSSRCDVIVTISNISLIWCAQFQGCGTSLLQGHQRFIRGGSYCGCGRGALEPSQANCSANSTVYWNPAKKVWCFLYFALK